MVWGAGIQHLGVVKMYEQIYQEQYAATVAKILGFNYTAKGHEVDHAVKSVTD